MGNSAHEAQEQDARVRLRPLLGLHPFLSYCLKILVLLLAICVIPSFFTSSRRLYVSSSAYPLLARLDGKPIGITPCNLRVAQGRHELELSYGGEVLHSEEFRIRPALFLSYILEYSKKIDVHVELSESVKRKVRRDFLQDCVDYQTLFVTDATHVQKPYFSYFKSLLGSDADGEAILAARHFVANASALEDFKSSFADRFEPLDISYPDSADFALRIDDTSGRPSDGLSYVRETEIMGRDFVEFDRLLVSKDLVDANLFRAFLQERTEFSESEKDRLEREGMADDDYLSAFTDGGSARSVPYAIVEEFMKWFRQKSSFDARLLTKPEYADVFEHRSRFRNFASGLFELTSTSFITSEALAGKRLEDGERDRICSLFEEAGIRMRKEIFCLGSYNSSMSDSDRLSLVGVISQDSCYETVGFRIAMDKDAR